MSRYLTEHFTIAELKNHLICRTCLVRNIERLVLKLSNCEVIGRVLLFKLRRIKDEISEALERQREVKGIFDIRFKKEAIQFGLGDIHPESKGFRIALRFPPSSKLI